MTQIRLVFISWNYVRDAWFQANYNRLKVCWIWRRAVKKVSRCCYKALRNYSVCFLNVCSATWSHILHIRNPEPEGEDSIIVETEEERRVRYQAFPLEECSDPELWMELHHWGESDSDDMWVGVTINSTLLLAGLIPKGSLYSNHPFPGAILVSGRVLFTSNQHLAVFLRLRSWLQISWVLLYHHMWTSSCELR